jgi:esterase
MRRFHLLVTSVAFAAVVAASGAPAAEAGRRPARLSVSKMEYTLVPGPRGADTVVFIHGLGSSQKTFAEVAKRLSRKYQVLVYSQRGHGKTAARGRDYSNELLARDLKGLVDHLGLGKVHMVGHSLGGRTAVKYAAMFPEHVKSLLIEDMEMQQRRPSSARHRREIDRQAQALRRSYPEVYGSKDEIAERLTDFLEGDARWARDTAESKTEALPDGRVKLLFRPHANLLYRHHSNGEDLGPELRSIRAPVMVLQADSPDGSITDRGIEHMQRFRPGVPIVKVVGSAHSIHRTNLEEFVSIADDFFTRSGKGARAKRPVRASRAAARRARTNARRLHR